ncbi:transcription elongation factor Spt5 [Lactarius pseudohatsudake]|nr:transcription elongation factor Spt5 [Lactarius pseudohatsudake]
MSDAEEERYDGLGAAEEQEEEEQEVQGELHHDTSRKQRRRREDDEDDEDEDEEEEDDDDDEDEEGGVARGSKRQKRRHKRAAVNRFLDVEAEVNEDEDEEEEDEEYGRDEFIAEPEGEGDDEDGVRRPAHHVRLDRRERELNDQDLARIAEDVSQRYKRSAVRYTGDMNEVPQRLLMPSVQDANLWQVRCKPGRERDLIFSLMRKSLDLEFSNRPLQILSAFERDSLPGMIYVEARSQKQVSEACNGLVGIYPSRGVTLVPIDEMASLLLIKKQETTVNPGNWVRIRRGKYQGDLAQVVDITENGEEVGLKFIPRIDLNPKDEVAVDGKKRKKTGLAVSTGVRPPQRFFNYEEVVKVYGRKMVSKRSQAYIFQNDTYKDGFIEKDFKLSAIVTENVNPTLDEITRFARGNQEGEGIENSVDLSLIAEASRKAAIAVLQPGDHVEVFEGEQAGVHGVVESINLDIVTVNPVGSIDLEGQKVQVPARSVRKRFKPGDHVKVMSGKNADESGLVVSVAGNIVTFLSDMSMQEVSVFSKDLREAAEVGTGTNIVGNYELHDLVQLDNQTVGVIFKTERDSFRVLDQNGEVRLVQPHQISMRRDSNRAIATDAEGYELRVGDNMKENDGEGRKGRVLHVHQSFFAFLHNREIIENGGVFVTRARSLVSLAPKGNIIRPGTDLSKMNPALSGGVTGGMVGSGMGRGPRDRLIGVLVTVVKGPQKGYIGIIKDTNGPIARAYRRNKDGKLEPLEGGRDMGPPRGGFGDGGFSGGFGSSGGRTPNPYATSGGSSWGGRTPNPYSGGKTPAWSSSKTPNPEGGRTPFHTSSQTPNPYAQDGGRTPGWGPSARTPNPYTAPSKAAASTGSGWGGATPGWGGATPKPSSSSWNESASPAPTTQGPTSSGGWGGESSWSAPTPAFGAPTPASAPTPGGPGYGSTVYNAQTPVGMFPNQLDKFWLVDPAYASHKIGMVVKVRGTRGDSANLLEWDHGQYEGKEGKVLGVLDTGSEFIPRTATLQMDEGESLTVPIIYLVPVPPTQVRNRVVALDGRYKGKVVTVRDMMLDSCLVTDDDSMYDDLTHDRMCLYLSDQ